MNHFEESPIKHTSGGFMPESRPWGVLRRRLQADEAVLAERSVWSKIAIPVALAGLAIGAFLLFSRKAQRRGSEHEDLSDWAA